MIHLITGTPGSGKTLLAVELILKNANAENIRPLYANINGLAYDELKCFQLDNVEYWFELPEHSIIVIDECQRWFRPRPNGSAVPEYISRFETHRHVGHDIILITQHPGLIDRNIRKLVELHQHMYRPFGLDHRKVFEWNTCNESPEPAQSEGNALKTKKHFDKSLFKYYTSATVHTATRRLPVRKLVTLVGSILIAVVLIGNFVHSKLAVATQGDSEKIKSENKPIEPDALHQPSEPVEQPISMLNYRGFIKSPEGLSLILEDSQTGEHFDLSDFDGYRKEGLDVVFYLAGSSQEHTYHVRNKELMNLLP